MSNMKKDGNTHTVRIQQTYWVKDTSEEKMMALGAVQFGRVVEQVDYYDTDLYDLAIREMWLSKMGQEWKLIVEKSTQSKSQDASNGAADYQQRAQITSECSKKHTSRTSNSKTSENQNNNSMTNRNGNTLSVDGNRKMAPTYHALGQENEIIAFLSKVLHVPEETSKMEMENFLKMAGIQRYASISNVTQETFRLPDYYTILLKTEGTNTKKTAVVSLDVDIENVTQGFQMLEQLANELDLQLQSI